MFLCSQNLSQISEISYRRREGFLNSVYLTFSSGFQFCRKDAKSVKIKKTQGVTKFKIRCSKVRPPDTFFHSFVKPFLVLVHTAGDRLRKSG